MAVDGLSISLTMFRLQTKAWLSLSSGAHCSWGQREEQIALQRDLHLAWLSAPQSALVTFV